MPARRHRPRSLRRLRLNARRRPLRRPQGYRHRSRRTVLRTGRAAPVAGQPLRWCCLKRKRPPFRPLRREGVQYPSNPPHERDLMIVRKTIIATASAVVILGGGAGRPRDWRHPGSKDCRRDLRHRLRYRQPHPGPSLPWLAFLRDRPVQVHLEHRRAEGRNRSHWRHRSGRGHRSDRGRRSARSNGSDRRHGSSGSAGTSRAERPDSLHVHVGEQP